VSAENQNILKSLFDIKPVDKTGRVDVEKIYNIQPVVNLGNPSMRLRVNQKPAKNLNKKALTDAASNMLVNSVGAACSAEFPGCHLNSSLSQPKLKSSESVDNQKPRFGEVVGSVDGTGFGHNSDLSSAKSGRDPASRRSPPTVAHHDMLRHANFSRKQSSLLASSDERNLRPSALWVATQDRHYTPPTVKLSYQKKTNPQEELEKYLNSRINIRRELKAIGAKVEKSGTGGKPRIRPISNSIKYEVLSIKEKGTEMPDTGYLIPNTEYKNLSENHEIALRQINERITPSDEAITGEPRKIYPFEYWATRTVTDTKQTITDKSPTKSVPGRIESVSQAEIESWIKYTRTNVDNTRTVADRIKNLKFERIKLLRLNFCARLKLLRFNPNTKRLVPYALTGLLVFTIFTSFGQYGMNVKNEVVKESNLAVANLEQASESLGVFDFEAASNNFAEAYEEFSKAGDNLNFMGASITSLFAELPGASKLKSAKNLVEAGRLLAEAGKSMSDVPLPNLLSVETQGLGPFKNALIFAGKNLSRASTLLSDISPDALPEGKRGAFLEFKSKLPELEGIVSDAMEYAGFLENFLGAGLMTSDVRGTSDVTKKYLVLFQNNSELRPTGGFPGTYAVVTFKNGGLTDFLVDDIYNLDGQLKENIIPPKPLQHITPNWGMRDANWFIDFSISAQKVMEFFSKAAGYEVDGVITMSPGIISDILKVVGPIEMPEYELTINDENFLSTVQAEVEYGNNREQPKSIVKDMAPKLIERINSSNPGRWLDIFNVFISGLDKKDILMYFRDLNLQSFVVDNEFSGSVKDTDGDYLMVTFTNIKGSKTDTVTDNILKLNSQFTTHNSQPVIKHRLTITRQHNGGDMKYGFYNKQNPAYVRALVPKGAELLSISGNSNPDFNRLMSYSGTDFKEDKDLVKLESSFVLDENSEVSIYEESGKTGFAFWLITDSGKQKTVELEYAVPFDYAQSEPYGIYIQKQPGLEVDNFEFRVGDTLLYNENFDKDLEFTLKVDN